MTPDATPDHPVAAHSYRLDQVDRSIDAIVTRVQRLVDDDHARSQRLAVIEAQGPYLRDAIAELKALASDTKQAVDDGFAAANGRTRKLETAVAVLQWAVGLVGLAAGSLWAIGLSRLFGGGQ